METETSPYPLAEVPDGGVSGGRASQRGAEQEIHEELQGHAFMELLQCQILESTYLRLGSFQHDKKTWFIECLKKTMTEHSGGKQAYITVMKFKDFTLSVPKTGSIVPVNTYSADYTLYIKHIQFLKFDALVDL